MHYDYFIASSTRTKDKIIELTEKLREKDKTVFSFIESDPLANPIGEEIPVTNWREDPRTKYIFEKDIVPLKHADHIILLLPAGKSAHIEAGIGYGLGKHCILIGEVEQTDSLYLIFKEDYKTIEDFIQTLE